jgi:predicted nucleic acid-binding protein
MDTHKSYGPKSEKWAAQPTMKTLICDTNIFIDLIQAQALDTFWRLPYEVYTTDLVMAEMTVPAQKAQLAAAQQAGTLIVLELSGEEVGRVVGLPTQRNLKRITDKSVLFKALELRCCLLTADRQLRLEAQNQGIEVHGSLWVIQQIRLTHLATQTELLRMVDALAKNPRISPELLQDLRDDINEA